VRLVAIIVGPGALDGALGLPALGTLTGRMF
jgi:hypothetical protein